MTGCLGWAIRIITGLVWAVLLVDLIVPDDVILMVDQCGRVLVGLAIIGSTTMIVAYFQRPVEEVFDAGREYQRRVDLRERLRHDNVTSIRRNS